MDSIQQLFIVLAVLSAFAVSLWTLQRRGVIRFGVAGLLPASRPQRKLALMERLQLTPQHAICLVRCGDRVLLIGTAPESCRLIEQLPQPSQSEAA